MLLLEALRDGKPSVRLALTPPCAPPCYDEVYDGSCLEEAEGAETATLTLALTLTPSPNPHPNPNPKPNPHPDSDPGPKPHPTPNFRVHQVPRRACSARCSTPLSGASARRPT